MAAGDKLPLNLPTMAFAQNAIQNSMRAIDRNIVSAKTRLAAGTYQIEEYINLRDNVIPGSLDVINQHRYRPGLIPAINADYHATFPDRLTWDVRDATAGWETALTNIIGWMAANDPTVSATSPNLTTADLPVFVALIDAYMAQIDYTVYIFEEV